MRRVWTTGVASLKPYRVQIGLMDLTGLLSNFDTEALYKRLTERDWQQVPRVQGKRRERSPDGKLRFGTVSGAVVEVLARAESSMRFIEIHSAVEELLGFPVARGSVKQCPSDEARHRRPRFVRVAHGCYKVLRRNHVRADDEPVHVWALGELPSMV